MSILMSFTGYIPVVSLCNGAYPVLRRTVLVLLRKPLLSIVLLSSGCGCGGMAAAKFSYLY